MREGMVQPGQPLLTAIEQVWDEKMWSCVRLHCAYSFSKSTKVVFSVDILTVSKLATNYGPHSGFT